MNSARVRSATGPSARKISETSNRVVGQTSGQWVKPKNTRNGRPFKSSAVTTCPFRSVSVKGQPMAAICCATGDDGRPVTIRTMPKQSTSPARNAAIVRRMRVLRAVISDSAAWRERSQAGGDPCDNHLTKSARACHPRAIGKKVGLVPPEILEAVRRKLGVAYRMLDVLVPQPSHHLPGVASPLPQRVTASVAQHARETRTDPA